MPSKDKKAPLLQSPSQEVHELVSLYVHNNLRVDNFLDSSPIEDSHIIDSNECVGWNSRKKGKIINSFAYKNLSVQDVNHFNDSLIPSWSCLPELQGPVMLLTTPIWLSVAMLSDIAEMFSELVKGQRVVANGVSLGLSAGYITMGAIALAAFAASNPVGWCVALGSVLIIGVASLIKLTRSALMNEDAKANSSKPLSCLPSDSRFNLLTETEEAMIRDKGYDVEEINDRIKLLTARAWNKRQFGLFGTKDNYKALVDSVMELKSGNISPEIRTQLKLNWSPTAKVIQEVGGKEHDALGMSGLTTIMADYATNP